MKRELLRYSLYTAETALGESRRATPAKMQKYSDIEWEREQLLAVTLIPVFLP